LRRQLLKDLKEISTMNKKGITLCDSIRWSIRPRCAEIGSCLENANFKTHALSHMESMNYIEKFIYRPISKPSYVTNFIHHHTVHMATDVSSFILNTTSWALKPLTTLKCCLKMSVCQMKEKAKCRKAVNLLVTSTYSLLRGYQYSTLFLKVLLFESGRIGLNYKISIQINFLLCSL
jgi:hypothetical protein